MPIQVWGAIIPPHGPALAQRHFGAIDSFMGEGLRVVVARTLCRNEQMSEVASGESTAECQFV